MTAKYLRNRKTGVVFPYNALLAKKNKNMEPYNGEKAAPVFEEVFVDTAQKGLSLDSEAESKAKEPELALENGPAVLMVGEVALDDASKEQMIEFALAAFGQKISPQNGEEKVRQKLRELLDAQG